MPTYAVTGASGRLGRLAVQELMSRGVPGSDVVAVARTPSKAADLAERGVQVREADYSRPQTLAGALAGVDRLLLISSPRHAPYAGEGANLALLDGAERALALVAHPDDVETALEAYETAMFPRAQAAAAMSAKGLEYCFNADAPRDIVAFFSGMGRGAEPGSGQN